MNLLRQSGEFVIKGPPNELESARAAPIEATAFEPELAILERGVRLAFQLAAASDPSARTVYLRLLRNTLVPVFQIDPQETLVRRAWPLTDHPFLVEVVESKEPRMGAIAGGPMGPHAREIQNRTGVLSGIAVPVTYKGSVHGILALGSRHPELLSDDLFQALIHVGQLLTAALAAGGSARRET
ncbi:MAG TPA: GAF domain-containing protein [Candidatus Dormibacteraeota bacterium]|nr:GAF domain-containing protein [Candidatus Dormibacteraeota bacterium]